MPPPESHKGVVPSLVAAGDSALVMGAGGEYYRKDEFDYDGYETPPGTPPSTPPDDADPFTSGFSAMRDFIEGGDDFDTGMGYDDDVYADDDDYRP